MQTIPGVGDGGSVEVDGKWLIDTGPSERGWHRTEAMLRCPQLFAWKYVVRQPEIVSIAKDPLIRGTLGHVGLAHHYARLAAVQRRLDPDMFHDPLAAVDLMVPRLRNQSQAAGEIAERFREPVKAALRDYFSHYGYEQLTVLGVEAPAEMVFGPDPVAHRMTQRIDLEVEDEKGRVWLWDHKFVGRISRDSVLRYTLSGQFLEMVWQGRQRHGDRFAGIKINFVAMQKPTKFLRTIPEPAPAALRRFPQNVVDAEQLIQLCSTRDPYNWPRAISEQVCVTPYGLCEAFELCRWSEANIPREE